MQYLLTEEEYSTLTNKSPDALLKETNTALKINLDEFQTKLSQTPTVSESKFDSLFITTGSRLCLGSYSDFITLFNGLSQATLNDSAKTICGYLTNLAKLFNYKPQFDSQKDLKAYRVSLQKKNLFNLVVEEGKRHLEFSDAKI